MMPSADTYLQEQIEIGLQIFLSEEYNNILKHDVLGMLNERTIDRFMDTYAHSKADPISVDFEMPQETKDLRAAIFIGLRDGAEDAPSLGNAEGTAPYEEDYGVWGPETVRVHRTENQDRYYFKLSKDIAEIEAIEEVTISQEHDYPEVDGKYYYFGNGHDLPVHHDELTFTVHYVPLRTEEQGGTPGSYIIQGFTATEAYSISAMSTNMDTVRCLDLIIKAILIMMRSNPKEQLYYNLQNVQFGQPEPQMLNGVNDDGVVELLYARENMVSYTVSYSLPDDPIKQITELFIKEGRVRHGE